MTQRLILGRHPLDGSYGIWLSRPGIDATTTVDPNNFLICPGVKNDMVMLIGQASGGQTVFFPQTLSDKPMVYFWPTNASGVEYYPFPTNAVTRSGETVVAVSASSMTFSDSTGLGLIFNYFVFNRSLP
jgi:hypothetical protein